MALYPRLLGTDPDRPKIPIHAFQSALAEWARGKLTAAQAVAVVTAASGVGLDAAEQADAQAIVNLVTSIPITGSAAAIADGKASRALKMHEIDQVFLLADTRAPGYDTEALLRAKLGV